MFFFYFIYQIFPIMSVILNDNFVKLCAYIFKRDATNERSSANLFIVVFIAAIRKLEMEIYSLNISKKILI